MQMKSNKSSYYSIEIMNRPFPFKRISYLIILIAIVFKISLTSGKFHYKVL